MYYKKQKVLNLREHLGSSRFLVWFWFLICLIFCVVFVCFRLLSCVPNVSSFSGLSILDCPFIFSGVYIGMKNNNPYLHPDLCFTVLGEVYPILLHVITFVSDLLFPQAIKLATLIELKYC